MHYNLHSSIFRCSRCSNNHSDCAAKTVFKYPDPAPTRITGTKRKAVVEKQSLVEKTINDNLNDDCSSSHAAAEKANHVDCAPDHPIDLNGDRDNIHGNDNDDVHRHDDDHDHDIHDNDDVHHHDDDHDHDHTRYYLSEETDILLRAMPPKLCSKGFGVVQNAMTNEIFVTGQVYKISSKNWIFIQGLQLLDERLESSLDKINLVFALYDNVIEFFHSNSTPGNQ